MINVEKVVREQYQNAANLNTRISIHSKYSVNKQGFGNWITSNYEIKKGDRILELGCGTGTMWKEHMDLAAQASELLLTDLSEGMLSETKKTLGEHSNISYEVVDIQDIPFEDESFDIVIANMMLYHVPDLDRGLAQVRRVLKTGGRFYCATNGENGIVEYVMGLLKDSRVESKTNNRFTLQNGGQVLLKYFSSVQRRDYPDRLEVTEVEDLIDYLYSLSAMTSFRMVEREVLKEVLEQNKKDGILHIPKEYGMFVCG